MIDIIRLYNDFGISHQTEGHKHVSAGWVGIACTECSGNPGYHLGYCLDTNSKYAGKFICWRCGGKNTVKILCSILGMKPREVYPLLKKYQIGDGSIYIPEKKEKRGPGTVCKLPSGTEAMNKSHKRYLEKRSFDPDFLEREWDLKGTGPVGSYNNRIIIPIYHEGILASYQGRDITGKSGMKYKACPQEKESRDHKNCLYGLDKVRGKSVVVVEGVTDVWRLGAGAVATFGVKFKQAQVRLLLTFERVFILYDSEFQDPQAGEQAKKLANSLTDGNRIVEIIELAEGDPGEMDQDDADNLMKELIKNYF